MNIESLEAFIEPLFRIEPGRLLYVDEIGQMQLYSARFKELVNAYLASENDTLGTISQIYEDDFIREVRQKSGVLICEITPENRDDMKECLHSAIKNRGLLGTLSPPIQQAAIDMGREYLRDGSYVYFRKLFKNAIPYAAEGKIAKDAQGFAVQGNTHTHKVMKAADGDLTCDCDLFNGRGVYEGLGGLCSHIQAVNLLALH